jgi:hypothetical protein
MTPSELQPLVDAEIAIEGHRTPADEQRIRGVLSRLPGIQEPTLYGGLLCLQYDPLSSTKSQIREALIAAGFNVSWMTAAPASPLTDALHPTQKAARG